MNNNYLYIKQSVTLQIESRLSGLMLCGATLRRVGEVFAREIENGLRERPSSLQMENTYVPELPNGTGTETLKILYLKQ